MSSDEGLPLPKPNPNFWVPKAEGLTPGLVSTGVAGIFRSAAGGDDLNVYNSVAKGVKPSFRGFQADGADPLAHMPSVLEDAVGSDTDALGPLKALANAIFTGLGRPVATISDLLSKIASPNSIAGRLARIDALQKGFFANHATDLSNLDAAMGAALVDMKALGNLLAPDAMDQFRLSAGPLQAILQKKQAVGRELGPRLSDAIANASDPDEKARLESEKERFDAWQSDCDQRLAADANQITDLQRRTNAVNRIAGEQSQAMLDAAYGDHPHNLTSDGNIVETTHTRPDALAYAASLRRSLIQSRVQMNGAIAGDL